ncbi:MAG: hypothetical protein D6743_06420 [Calditrichaeota bacterium]|nr:MAG: hypothetical protein D6743_06420 [Calditrichota bacterium]
MRFFVFDLRKNRIVYEHTFPAGTVAWRSTTELQINVLPGIVPAGGEEAEAKSYIYDLGLNKILLTPERRR